MTRLKELWAALRARYQAQPRVVQLVVIVGAWATVALTAQWAIVAAVNYRARVGEEIDERRQKVERLRDAIARADVVHRNHETLSKRVDELRGRLVPGDTGTLAAANLQDRVNTIANEKGVSVQSTQVMREDQAGAFRKVTVRLTLTGSLRSIAEFLEAVEYGPQQLSVPFLQVDRRGAVAARGAAQRTLSATVEVSGLMVAAAPVAAPAADAAAPES
jgi:general secretion pathway protein M